MSAAPSTVSERSQICDPRSVCPASLRGAFCSLTRRPSAGASAVTSGWKGASVHFIRRDSSDKRDSFCSVPHFPLRRRNCVRRSITATLVTACLGLAQGALSGDRPPGAVSFPGAALAQCPGVTQYAVVYRVPPPAQGNHQLVLQSRRSGEESLFKCCCGRLEIERQKTGWRSRKTLLCIYQRNGLFSLPFIFYVTLHM